MRRKGCPSETHVKRARRFIRSRIAAGGHGIPEADIRRRHARGLALFPVYRQLADSWYHFTVV